MQQMEYDNWQWCRICRNELSDEELEENKISKMPALCREHLKSTKEQLKKCLPLFSKMKL